MTLFGELVIDTFRRISRKAIASNIQEIRIKFLELKASYRNRLGKASLLSDENSWNVWMINKLLKKNAFKCTLYNLYDKNKSNQKFTNR